MTVDKYGMGDVLLVQVTPSGDVLMPVVDDVAQKRCSVELQQNEIGEIPAGPVSVVQLDPLVEDMKSLLLPRA